MSFELIETVEVGAGGAASIEFTSIPQDGTDLVLKLSLRASVDYFLCLVSFNTDGNTNLSGVELRGNGSSTTSANGASAYTSLMNESTTTANTFSNSEIYISNYTSSSAKSISQDEVTENNATDAYQFISAVLWDNNAAITSIKIDPAVFSGGAEFVQHSTASLYKVTAA